MSSRKKYRSSRISSLDHSEDDALSEPTDASSSGHFDLDTSKTNATRANDSERDLGEVFEPPHRDQQELTDDESSDRSEMQIHSIPLAQSMSRSYSKTLSIGERTDHSETDESIISSLGEEVSVAKKTPRKTRDSRKEKRPTTTRKIGKSKTTRRRGRVAVIDSTSSENDDTSLYDAILSNNILSPLEIARSWIKSYGDDKESAILRLQQFFITSSGCTARLTPEMRQLEIETMIISLNDHFDKKITDYPLIMRSKKWLYFRRRFIEFLENLITECDKSIIYDEILLPEIRMILIVLSDSEILAFRHTATYAAMKLMSLIAKVTNNVRKHLATTKDRLRNEKMGASPLADRIEMFTNERKLLEENLTVLKENIDLIFSAIFVNRYIDGLSDIRAICSTELGICMQKLPDYFIADKYLKYLGWNLHDESAEVRFECIQSLLPLYSSTLFATKLEGFTNVFKKRMFAMVLDVNFEVATEAVKLATEICINYPEYLGDEDFEKIYVCAYSRDRAHAQAAGVFLNAQLFRVDENSVNGVKSRRGKQRLPNTPLIRDLIQFFIESEHLEHAEYLVDSLIESNDMIKDWECMTDLLLEDTGPNEQPLSSQDETCLINIMVCSVKQAATGEVPIGRTTERKIHSKQKQKRMIDDKKKLTDHFIPTLPLLLEKYKPDPEKLVFLLAVPRYFDLQEYTELREEQNLEIFLDRVNDIVMSTSSADVLEVTSKTYEYLCADESNPICARCDIKRSILFDSLISRFRGSIEVYRNPIDDSELSDTTFDFIESLKKISIFYRSHNMNSWNTQQSLFDIIEYARNALDDIPSDALVYCITTYYYSIIWSNYTLRKNVADASGDLEEEARQLEARLHSFIDLLKYFVNIGLRDEKIAPSICENAYLKICDLIVIFCTPVSTELWTLYPVDYTVDHAILIALNVFLLKRVFVESEIAENDDKAKITDLNMRRNFLAAYCKLITNNIVSLRWAVDVFKNYVTYNNDYGDIIKATISSARATNKINCAVAMQQSLAALFSVAFEDASNVAEDFSTIKETARRFSLLFGFQAEYNREALIALHQAGILFATRRLEIVESDDFEPPANLRFLEILTEFTGKLFIADKLHLLEFLKSKVPSNVPNRSTEWKPFYLYRTSLQRGAAASTTAKNQSELYVTDDGDEPTVQVTKGTKKKKRAPKKTPLPVTKVRYETSVQGSGSESSQVSAIGLQTRKLNLTESERTQRTSTRTPELYAEDEIMDISQ